MERVANPQAVDIGGVRFPLDDDSFCTYSLVPRLSVICLSVLSPPGNLVNALGRERKNIPSFCPEVSASRYHPTMRTGQLCTLCHCLFPSFRDYENHLKMESCPDDVAPNPVPIEMSDSGTIPLNYMYHRKQESTSKLRLMICSLCHCDRFSTSQQFHEHILDCANKLAAL